MEYTDFGIAVKTKLLGPPARPLTWLAKEVQASTGLYVDSAYMAHILTGRRKAKKIVTAIREILDLPEQTRPLIPAESEVILVSETDDKILSFFTGLLPKLSEMEMEKVRLLAFGEGMVAVVGQSEEVAGE